MSDELEVWQQTVGEAPFRVIAEERLDKDRVVYLRWWVPADPGRANGNGTGAAERARGNWGRKSTGIRVRTQSGRIVASRVAEVMTKAQQQKDRLIAGLPDEERPTTRLTLLEGLRLATDAKRGKYKVDTPHRREIIRSMQHVIRILGERRTWESMRIADLSEVWTDRIHALQGRGHTGMRSAEIVIRDLLAVAAWLREEEHIPPTACFVQGTAWKHRLRNDWVQFTHADREPTPERPRYSLGEFRAILQAAKRIEPRLAFLLELGAEQRGGQVNRCRRTDLDLATGRLKIPYRGGHKKTATLHLTAGQLAYAGEVLATGYLRELEALYQAGAIADYPLFPGGYLKGSRESVHVGRGTAGTVPRKNGRAPSTHALRMCLERGYCTRKHAARAPLSMNRMRRLFRRAEQAAGVAYIKGRGIHGMRRGSVDEAKRQGISREGLQAHGGWVDTQVPDRIYADQEAEAARDEARNVRAAIRGEAPEESAG